MLVELAVDDLLRRREDGLSDRSLDELRRLPLRRLA
jgi:hypothetical protein